MPQSKLDPAVRSQLTQQMLQRVLGDESRPVASHVVPLEPGNIELVGREEIPNPKGGTSTVYSASFNIDGQEVLLPLAADGRILSEQEAIRRYEKTGQHLGKFKTPDDATTYAKELHDQYAKGAYRP